jgi:MFS family permease
LLTPSEPSPQASSWPRTFRALRNRNFRLFWSGQTVSSIGTWMQIVAQGWLVYRLTDSALMLGLVSVVGLAPVVPVSLLAGVVSDRFSRRRLIIASEVVLGLVAFALAALTWLQVIEVWHIVVLTFVLGAAAALEQPARLAFVMDAVGREDLSNAVALNSAMYNSARIVGPAIAGILVAWIGEAGCFFINAMTYLATIFAMLAIRLPQRPAPSGALELTGSLVEGLRYVWNAKTIRALMSIVAISSFLTLPYVTLMPIFARDVLLSGPEGLGFLMTAVGAGAIVGALGVASIEAGRRGRWLALGNVTGPLFLALFCVSRSFPLSLALVAMVGASNAVRQTLANSLIQVLSREDYHGRVMSIFNLNFNGSSRIGALGVGSLAEVIGAPLAVGLAALLGLGWAVIVLLRMPYVHRLS